MGSLADIRAGIAANLATVLDGVGGGQVSAYVLNNPTLPVIWVRLDPSEGIEYHRAMRDGVEFWTMRVEAYVGAVSDIGAQKNLDLLLESSGATSVKAAIESDLTLGGAAQKVRVERCAGYQEYGRPDGTSALGSDWTVVVYP